VSRFAHIPVLLYHGVCDVPLPGLRRWTLAPATFDQHLAAIAASGRTPLTMSALADGLAGRALLPESPVAITFDDGFADTLTALDAVLERGLAATVYVQTGRVGREDWLSARGLRAVAALGPRIEVGAHTICHQRVDELSGAALEREVAGSRRALEEILGAPVAGFAYPHGAHDRRSRDAVVAAGYTHAAAVKNALSHPHDDPFAIARWTVEAGTTPARIAEVLAGEGVRVATPGVRVATTAYRGLRRLRRRLAGGRA
jgi:peptidoglycan/xylan/chitin deacetylase (PgdA/CDA1 family)